MIALAGITIHDPDVAVTDAGLAIIGVVLGWRLWKSRPPSALRTSGVVILLGLASAALWGAVFHGSFTEGTRTRGGYLVWLPVAFSIAVVSATLVDASLRLILSTSNAAAIRRTLVVAFSVAFLGTVLLVDESFHTIVRFYAPALLLFLVVATWQAVRTRSTGWSLVAASFTVSAIAAVLQQAKVALHPDYFDHNALYHLLEAVALILLYLGFGRITNSPARPHRGVTTASQNAP